MHKNNPYPLFSFFLFLLVSSAFYLSASVPEFPDSFPEKQKEEKVFSQLLFYPHIKDTLAFVDELVTLGVPVTGNISSGKGAITYYKKQKIYGYAGDLFFIEYDYQDGSGAEYPWKYQFLLTEEGKLLEVFDAKRFEFTEVFPEKNPFLLLLQVTFKGNGRHKVYRVIDGLPENVLGSCPEGEWIKTYDAHKDYSIYEPYELMFHVKDVNEDGFPDILFEGNILFLKSLAGNTWYDTECRNGEIIEYSAENPFVKVPLTLVFLYNEKNGYFEAAEVYDEAYFLSVVYNHKPVGK